MTCWLSCVIWLGGIGYSDVCSREVTKLLETQNYYYVEITGKSVEKYKTYKTETSPKQQVAKPDCKLEK